MLIATTVTTSQLKDNPPRGLTYPLSDVKNVRIVFQNMAYLLFMKRFGGKFVGQDPP